MKNLMKSVGVASAVALSLSALTAFAAVSADVNVGLGGNVSAGSAASAVVSGSASSSASAPASDSSMSASMSGTDASAANADMNASAGDDSSVNASIQGILNSDSNVTKVDASNDSVGVWYKEPGKFLGFIPVMVSTEASADANGNAKISHPWYDFLTVTADSAAQAQLQSQISGSAGANGQLSDSVKISLMNAIHALVSAWESSNASATTTASASY